jgi:hypothetical protein
MDRVGGRDEKEPGGNVALAGASDRITPSSNG